MPPADPRTGHGYEPINFSDVPSYTADRLLMGYRKHISTRWPMVHFVFVRELHVRRHAIVEPYEAAILHLVYATAARFLETAGEVGAHHMHLDVLLHPQRHLHSDLRHLDAILNFQDTRAVSAPMLMAVYCLRDCGLHRETKAGYTKENQRLLLLPRGRAASPPLLGLLRL